MFAPLDNEDFLNHLDVLITGDLDSRSEVLASMIDPDWVTTDELTINERPSLAHIEETAYKFGVQPFDIFSVVSSDIINRKSGSAEDFLIELLQWIVFASPLERARVFEGYALSERPRLEEWRAFDPSSQAAYEPNCVLQ